MASRNISDLKPELQRLFSIFAARMVESGIDFIVNAHIALRLSRMLYTSKEGLPLVRRLHGLEIRSIRSVVRSILRSLRTEKSHGIQRSIFGRDR